MFRTAATTALLLACPAAVWADAGTAVEPGTLWRAWNCDLLILLNLSLLGWLYLRGLRRLWHKAGGGQGVSRGQAAAYLVSLAVLFAALLSPLDALSAELASAHMIQHMLLMVVAAPLFVLGVPGLVLTWGLPQHWRPMAGSWRRSLDADALGRPLLPWGLYAATLWVWHLPVLYQAALADPLVHDAQHLSFFAAACLFWRVLLDPLRRRRLHPVMAVIVLFTTSLHAALLGVFMTLSPALWYDVYAGRTAAWGLTPLEDQQLAGLIMWMPACLVYPAVAAAVFGLWLAALSETDRRECRQPVKGV
jgi:cytochrome c oxidase assembly factor CtaG